MRRHVSLAIDDLRTIVAVAEEQNFHRAGRKVGLTQSGVTRAVARVEQYAGAVFFERSHSKRHSVSPTDAGRCFVERARLAIAHSESAVVSARETLHGIEHRIVVGKSWYTDRRFLTILRSMELPLYPGLQVVLETRLPGELAVCVRAGEFDLAIISNPIEDQFLTGTVVRCTPFVVLLPADHQCADKQTVTLNDLASTPWVLFGRQIHPSLAARIQLPVPGRVFVGRIEDRMLEKAVFHRRLSCPFAPVLHNYRSGAITMISKTNRGPCRTFARPQIAISENDISVRRTTCRVMPRA